MVVLEFHGPADDHYRVVEVPKGDGATFIFNGLISKG